MVARAVAGEKLIPNPPDTKFVSTSKVKPEEVSNKRI